ncbi:peptidylprolyl isomerase [Haloferula helveola]|uniref:peptidylprolyl isomerase n=1 Tax=Haloferula helveola TaxID=490095 RepID=A0ABN6H257_9BACT|nr:peptidylprolyl isomerase [Haloferula helveola]
MITVNGETIDPALVEDAFLRIKSEAESRSEISCCERDEEFRHKAEDEVIEGILLAQEAERRVPEPNRDEVREALENSLREWRSHGASWDMLEQQRDQLREETVARLRMERFADDVWRDLPELDEAALREWYDENAELFRKPGRARVRHLVRFPGDDPAAEYRKITGLRGEVLDGANFAEVAKEHTAREDGETDLGWIEHERTLNPFEAMLFSLREGELSPVFSYEQGLHLVRIEELEPEHIPPFEELEETIREQALADQRREALHQLAVQLREKAEVTRDED